MSKAVNWIGGIFLAFGLTFAGVGVVNWSNKLELVENGDRAQGEVIRLERRRDSEGNSTYHPVVVFRDANGASHRFVSSVGSRPAAFDRGEKVEVIYDPWAADEAMIDSFSTRYLLPLVFGVIGLIFALIGGGMIFVVVRRKRIIAELKASGIPLQAEFKQCYLDTSIKVNGRSPYRVIAQATHPATGQITSFKSDPIWVDVRDELEGQRLTVLVDPQRPKRYFIDLSKWVSEDELG